MLKEKKDIFATLKKIKNLPTKNGKPDMVSLQNFLARMKTKFKKD